MNNNETRDAAAYLLFAGAAGQPTEARDRFLAEACGSDDTLREQVAGALGAMAHDESDPSAMPTIGSSVMPAAVPGSAAVMGADPDSEVPLIFGRQIARGGMGAILEGDDCRLGRKIAVKIMLDPHAKGDVARRFVQEAAVLGRLQHPNIVPIHDLGRDAQGQLYYTMKLVKGRTLQHILNDLRDQAAATMREHSLASLLMVFRKVCDALAFAHSQGVLHRDLKPENVMVGEFGEVLVMDWGLAKELDREKMRQGEEETTRSSISSSPLLQVSPSFTLQGSVMGTPQYMSPEQARGEVDELDARSDVFSLGGILYAILTLRPPVEGDSLEEILSKVRSGTIAPPTSFNAPSSSTKAKAPVTGAVMDARKIHPLPHCPEEKVPVALSAVAMKALARDKTQRYQTVSEFTQDIEAYQGGFATRAENADALTLALLFFRRNKVLTSAAALVLLVILIALPLVIASEGKARANASLAGKKEGEARQALAKSQLDLAEKEFERGKFIEAQKIIEETPASFRDASWRFLRAHSHDFTAQLSLRGRNGVGSALRLQVLPQEDRFAARCWFDDVGLFTLTGEQIGDWLPVRGARGGAFGLDSTAGRLAFAVSDNEVAVQEVATGKLIRRWTCEIGKIDHVLLSPDGGTLLAAGGKQLIAYAMQTGAPLWAQPFHGVVPAFSSDGRTVAIFSAQVELALKVQLLDTLTGAVRSTLEATADNPVKTSLQFNQAGDRLACIGGDEVILWNTQTTAKIRALHFPGETASLLNPRGDVVATFSGNRIRLWDTTTGRLLRSLNGASTAVLALAFSPDGKMLLSAHQSASSGVVNVWPTRVGEEIASARPGTLDGRRVLFDREASGFYACARDGAAAWDIPSGVQRWKSSKSSPNLPDLAIHPTDGSIILSEAGKPAFTHVSSDGKSLEAFGTNANSSVKFNRTGQLLLAVQRALDAIISGLEFSVMEYPSGNVLRKIRLEKPGQPFAAFCLDDAAVATAAKAGGITVWDWKAGTPLRQIAAAQTGSIACLASSPDGRHLASGGPDRWIRVWEAATGRLETAFRAHWEGVRCVKFSPDGSEILSGSEDGTVLLHDAATGEERLALYGLNTPVVDVDISADGKLIAAITTDGYTKVWDRQLSIAAAMPPKVVTEVERVATASPAAKKSPPAAPGPVLPKDADGWEDLLARLTPTEVAKTGHGWSLKEGELFSPDTKFATLPLPGDLSGTSYTVRVKLRQLPAKGVFHVVLPVADRMCGFDLDGFPDQGHRSGLIRVNGKAGKNLPETLEGKQVNDAAPHDLEVTVRLDGANATITTTLDGKPLHEWTGPTAALSQHKNWATTEPGALALGTYAGGWAVSEVKVKRLDAKP